VFKGFREFISRGNVIDLAVAFVIGAAFAALVSQFTRSFLDPLIRVILGGGVRGGTFTVRGQTFDYGGFINALITFVLTAAAVYYFVVVPANVMAARRSARLGRQGVEDVSEEVQLLTEIRDRLPAGRG